jgi:general stress protein 26
MITKELIYQFIAGRKLGAVSTVNSNGEPESAVVSIAVSESLEVIFDTVKASRKYQNILHHANVALVIGWDDEITVQYEGTAEVLGTGDEADRLRAIYYQTYPDGPQRAATWPGLVHIKVTPNWIRYSDFNEPPLIEELSFNSH